MDAYDIIPDVCCTHGAAAGVARIAFPSRPFIWYAVSVACLSFYPMMHTVWSLREEPILCRIFLAVDQALPYGFAATLYSQMMTATAGLGFATIVPAATVETEKAFAIFLFTLALLFGLSSLDIAEFSSSRELILLNERK